MAAEEPAFDASALENLPGMGSAPPVIGSNLDGGSVFENYIGMRGTGQFFLYIEYIAEYETPDEPGPSKGLVPRLLFWCSNIEFTDINTDLPVFVGYTANCVMAALGDTWSMTENTGGQHTSPLVSDEFVASNSLSAVYAQQTNVFEGHIHKNTDNYVFRFLDDGRPATPVLMWETHDEGDTDPKEATSSWSGAGTALWISADEAAQQLGVNATSLTPDAFDGVYEDVWDTGHAVEAVADDPDSEAELDSVEEVADEANGISVPAGAEDEVADNGDTEDEILDDSGSGRKLSAVPAGVLSALVGFFQ